MVNEKRSLHQTLEQARARSAWDLVWEVKEKRKDIFDKYESLVKGFPAIITNNGLGQAVAYLFSKSKTEDGSLSAEGLLLSHLEKWLCKSELNEDVAYYPRPYDEEYNENKPGVLLESIREKDSTRYRQATLEALAFINYLRRFASGLEISRTRGENHESK